MRFRSCIYRHLMRSAYPKSSALLLLQLAVRKQCKMHISARCLQQIVYALKGNISKVLLRQPFLYLLAGDANPLKPQTKNALRNDSNGDSDDYKNLQSMSLYIKTNGMLCFKSCSGLLFSQFENVRCCGYYYYSLAASTQLSPHDPRETCPQGHSSLCRPALSSLIYSRNRSE